MKWKSDLEPPNQEVKRVLEVTASVAESTLSIPIPGGGLLDNSIFFVKPLGSKVLIKLKASFQ